jgi:hypothetical protein
LDHERRHLVTTGEQLAHGADLRVRDLAARFDTAGWGLLFVLFGALAMPNGTAEYLAVAAVGALMLALNAGRVAAGVPVRWFSIILGSVTLIAGAGAMTGIRIDAFVLFFFVLGIATVAGAIVRPRVV